MLMSESDASSTRGKLIDVGVMVVDNGLPAEAIWIRPVGKKDSWRGAGLA